MTKKYKLTGEAWGPRRGDVVDGVITPVLGRDDTKAVIAILGGGNYFLCDGWEVEEIAE